MQNIGSLRFIMYNFAIIVLWILPGIGQWNDVFFHRLSMLEIEAEIFILDK